MSGAGAGRKEAEKTRRRRVVRTIGRTYSEARCALVFSDPLQLLVATVLSAQCTDERVNLVTKSLFRKYRTAADYSRVPRETLEEEIRSTGFFRSKAKAIQGLSAALEDRHGGRVPSTMEELTALPGVGRKTANVVLGEGFGIGAGIVVDTHVHRLSRRLGLSSNDDAVKIEKDLMEIVPRSRWRQFGMQMITHGRRVCQARRPRCAECVLLRDCPYGQHEHLLAPGRGRREAGARGATRPRAARRAT